MYKCSSKIIKKGGEKSDEVRRSSSSKKSDEVRRSSSSKKRDAPSSSSSANNSNTRKAARKKRSDLSERSGSRSPTKYCEKTDMEEAPMIRGKGKEPWGCPRVPEFITPRQLKALSDKHYARTSTHLHIKKKGGNSNKYLMKINKIKETLKLLKKNKVKNKVKITKLNKSIEGLKKKRMLSEKKRKLKNHNYHIVILSYYHIVILS